jgi:hypothetical protein
LQLSFSLSTANYKTESPIKIEKNPPSENFNTNSTSGEKDTISHCSMKAKQMNLAPNENMFCAVVKQEFEHHKFETSHGTLIKQHSTLLSQSSSSLPSLPQRSLFLAKNSQRLLVFSSIET